MGGSPDTTIHTHRFRRLRFQADFIPELMEIRAEQIQNFSTPGASAEEDLDEQLAQRGPVREDHNAVRGAVVHHRDRGELRVRFERSGGLAASCGLYRFAYSSASLSPRDLPNSPVYIEPLAPLQLLPEKRERSAG